MSKWDSFLNNIDNKIKKNIKNNDNPNPNPNPNNDIISNIKEINYVYNTKYKNSDFTGINRNDLLITEINRTRDPNLFNPNNNNNNNKKNETKNKTNKNDKKEIITIEINEEIKTIEDLINLINKYPDLNKDVEYSINLHVINKIKNPLINLNNMIGMKSLKNSILNQILYYVQNLHSKHNDFLHTVIYGSPGTGKTEVAKIIGKIFNQLGMLEKGTFNKVTRSDLVAGYLGQTAIKTKDVIKDSLGGVLFIDEAYSLGNPEKKDSFSKECIDTLCEALSDYKDEIMVIIAGYENELNDCFFNYNKGLDSRFTWRYKIDDYTSEDLFNILTKKINEIDWKSDLDKTNTIEWFNNNKDYFPFYGRDIENLLLKIKIAHSNRIFGKGILEFQKKLLTIEDLEKGFVEYKKNNYLQKIKSEKEIKKSINSMYI